VAKREVVNDRALLAASLRRKKMTIADIARYLRVSERQVFYYLNRAQELYRLLVKTPDAEKYLGERLQVFIEMEQEALSKYALLDPKSTIALGYLNAARDASKEIKKLLQEAGMITKVPEQLDVTPGFNFANEKVRAAYYQFLKIAKAEGENILGLP
jgi:predicted transcriptional regulator